MDARLILADENTATRSALAFILGHRLGLAVTGEAACMAELSWVLGDCSAAHTTLVLNWDLPGLCPRDGIPALRRFHPDLRIIVLSTRLEVRALALAAGADAFISMSEPPEVLLSIVHTVVGRSIRAGSQP